MLRHTSGGQLWVESGRVARPGLTSLFRGIVGRVRRSDAKPVEGLLYRKPRLEDPRLEKLLDDRDHLRIKINLAEAAGATHPDAITEMRRQLIGIEKQILDRWSGPNA